MALLYLPISTHALFNKNKLSFLFGLESSRYWKYCGEHSPNYVSALCSKIYERRCITLKKNIYVSD